MERAKSIAEATKHLDGFAPFAALPEAVRATFTSSLEYHNDGLAHMTFGMLTEHLGNDELNEVFTRVGAAMDRLQYLRDKSCRFVGPGRMCVDVTGDYCDTWYCRNS